MFHFHPSAPCNDTIQRWCHTTWMHLAFICLISFYFGFTLLFIFFWFSLWRLNSDGCLLFVYSVIKYTIKSTHVVVVIHVTIIAKSVFFALWRVLVFLKTLLYSCFLFFVSAFMIQLKPLQRLMLLDFLYFNQRLFKFLFYFQYFSNFFIIK